MKNEKVNVISKETLGIIISGEGVTGKFLALDQNEETGRIYAIACDCIGGVAYTEEFNHIATATSWLLGECDADEAHEADTKDDVPAAELAKVFGWLGDMDRASSDEKTPGILRMANQYAADVIRCALSALGIQTGPTRKMPTRKMKRLTVDTTLPFCDIVQCASLPGGPLCPNGKCDQRRVYERLREYEQAEEQGRIVVAGDQYTKD